MSEPLRPGDPRQLGGYRLLRRLGQGGMGAVYLGRGADGRLVAVKVIRPEYADEEEFRGRFRSEVNRARQVPPFCTAELLDADPDHRTPYLVVEYVDGPSLTEVIKERGPLAAGNLHSVAVGVATALAAIHGAGVIHRDLKPGNVLFSLGTPKVIDFGIARAFETTSQHTRTDQMVGTVAYMAPERFETGSTRTLGPAADVFAWGAVVAYAGTGRTPFQGDSAAATAARILTQPPDLSGLPRPLRDLVGRTLAKDPRDRPTAHELLELLLTAGPQGALEQRPELRRAAEAARRGRRRNAGRVWLAAALVALLAVGGAFASRTVFASFKGGARDVAAAPSAAPSPSRIVQGPSIVDRLDRPGQWVASNDQDGSCAFDGRLVVTTSLASEYECEGPDAIFSGNQSVSLDAAVVTPGACAVVWFRYVASSGYQVSLCENEVRIGLYNDGEVTGELRAPSTAFQVGQRHRAVIAVRDESASITVDGATLLAMPLREPSLVAGQVVLGALNDIRDGDVSVAFADTEIRSPKASSQFTYADLARGDSASIVKLYSYDAAKRSAVVEPVIFMTGADFCKTYKIKRSESRCSDEWTTEDSHLKVTVPVVPEPALTTWDDNGDVCIDSPTSGGVCPTSPSEFASWLTANPEGFVKITVEDGTATKLAQMYAP